MTEPVTQPTACCPRVRHNFSPPLVRRTPTQKKPFIMIRLSVLLSLLVAIMATLTTTAFAPAPAFSKTVGTLKLTYELLKEKQPTRFF